MTCYDAILSVDYESDGVITVPCPVGTRGQARSGPCISWEAPANGRLGLLAHALYFCARKAWKLGCVVARRPPPPHALFDSLSVNVPCVPSDLLSHWN